VFVDRDKGRTNSVIAGKQYHTMPFTPVIALVLPANVHNRQT
jgi:hypothetical protein